VSDVVFPPPVEMPPVTAEVARPSAQASLAPVEAALTQAMASVENAKDVAESWTDDFWAVCGYDKATTLEALTELEKLTRIYAGEAGLAGTQDFSASAAVLSAQSGARR
jgi:hypothetical protein